MRTHTREYGYARVSTRDQNEDRQLTVLLDQGIPNEFIFIDKVSGKNFDRPEYQLLKRVLREGDTLFVKSINRFGRNKQEILKEWQWLIDANVHVVVIDIPILDTRKYQELEGVGKLIMDLVLHILSWLAEEEWNDIKQAQAEGIAAARKRGKHLGRPAIQLSTLSPIQSSLLKSAYPKWKSREMTGVELMTKLDLKKNTFYKIIKEYENSSYPLIEGTQQSE
ncbi:recombinase family protein [Paenibacillus hunanensis]|uniref:DNA invertase Pin-like site-specific DNA recombinase n=1 Tax=Paenibacillus hunanensis TaxID=539262 RepID=A0ABU1IZ71_9BACL|nr:recombinase family protein [Paenibacillus hunanensis]MDR6243518.1 DNA invertase Pin-like site-specific DNA recombinase [Paenibacillus hunanensis]GGI98323.1 DNA recombinase [Paenibacillus hunanensis]